MVHPLTASSQVVSPDGASPTASSQVVSPDGASPYCLFPSCIVTWARSLAKGQYMYMVSWLLTGAPEQRYWQNRETANIGAS